MKTPEKYYNNYLSSSKNTILETIRLAQLETIDEAVKVLEEELDSALAFDSIPDFDMVKRKLYELKKDII